LKLKCREDIKDYLKMNAHRLPPTLRRRLAHLLGCYSRDEVIQFIDEMAQQQAPNGGPITLMPLIIEKHVCRRDLDALLQEMARKCEKLPCGCIPITGLTEKAGPSISEEEYDALKPELQCIL
jgi:hypothetical protein